MKEAEAQTDVFRAPMRARSVDADRYAGARLGVELGWVGMGEPLDEQPTGPEEAALALTERHGDKAGRMLARFAGEPEGVFVWTRTDEEEFRLGRINGPWEYLEPERAGDTGIAHVRSTIWLPEEFDVGETPEGVGATFLRGGRNFQRINDADAERQTIELWRP